MFCHIPTLTL